MVAACAVCVAGGSDTGGVNNAEDTIEVRAKLEAFDKGEATLEQVTEPGGETWGRKMVAYYLAHSNAVTTKMKLPISRCYMAMENYPEAAKLAQEYVNVFSNDWRGWRIIGGANYLTENFEAAVNAYTNAVRLGNVESSAPLALAALKTERFDVFREIVPGLLRLKDAKETQYGKRLEIVMALVMYSLSTNQEDVFEKAIYGLLANDVLSRGDLEFLVKQGCDLFKSAESARLCAELVKAPRTNPRTPN